MTGERNHRPGRPDPIHADGRSIALVKADVEALRTIRTALIDLAYELTRRPGTFAYLLLVRPGITRARLDEEWRRAAAILQPEVLQRLAICISADNGRFDGLPAPPPDDVQPWLAELVQREAAEPVGRLLRVDYEFVLVKLLIHQWLTRRTPVTTGWLAAAAGCSYPTVARVLKSLGNRVERQSDRSVSLAFFPRPEFARLVANSERQRSTIRYVDRSGQPRTPEEHLRRLEALRPVDVAIGGVLGARHYLPDLDLVGTPRLDLSIHCPGRRVDLGLARSLDPALRREDDPHKPANVIVHAVRHADPLFTPRAGGLAWADPVECILDLYEARLDAQAEQFIDEFSNRPPGGVA